MLPVRAHHLAHIGPLGGEVASEAGTPRPGALDTDGDDVAVATNPAPQLPIADGGRRERGGTEQASRVVERSGDVDVLVSVDAAG